MQAQQNLRLIEEPAESAIIDRATLLALKASMGDAFSTLATYFSEDLLTAHDELQTAYKAGDNTTLKRIAHTLKSSSMLFGCQELSALALEVERAAKDTAVSDDMVKNLMGSIREHITALAAVRLEHCA